jgi:hypothetical protein
MAKNIYLREQQLSEILESDFSYFGDDDNSGFKEYSDDEISTVDKINGYYPKNNAPDSDDIADTLTASNFWWVSGNNRLSRLNT